MHTIGIICEYNPFHTGHRRQFDLIRAAFGADAVICCAMSGNYVQRGAPAVFDRTVRAKAALLSGANLVLELPVTVSLSSAEGFARGGVTLLSGLCDALCFGSECGDAASLLACAQALLEPGFGTLLREELKKGVSFPAARQAALLQMGHTLPETPNDILGVEYCKAILELGSSMVPYPVVRNGDYHAQAPDRAAPSATSLRRRIAGGEDWLGYVPEAARDCFRDAAVHTVDAGEKAILYRLRTMADSDFAALPYGSEGLWRRFMHAAREKGSLEEILTAVKTKRYTRTRLDRMALCAFLGITQEALSAPAPYARILAFDDLGRTALKGSALCKNLGWQGDGDYAALEQRCNALYGFFCRNGLPPADAPQKQRLFYLHR